MHSLWTPAHGHCGVGRAGQERPAATPTPRVSEGGGELSEGERGGEKKW